jgi:hypothetical protein
MSEFIYEKYYLTRVILKMTQYNYLFVIQMAVSLKNREPALAQVFVPSNENYN